MLLDIIRFALTNISFLDCSVNLIEENEVEGIIVIRYENGAESCNKIPILYFHSICFNKRQFVRRDNSRWNAWGFF